MQAADVIALHYCARCRRFAITVTLGGFLTIVRCDVCEWFSILTTKREQVTVDAHDVTSTASKSPSADVSA